MPPEPARLVPVIKPAMRPFFAAARRRELVVQRCRACGTLRFPARSVCAHCLGRNAEWVPVSGRGEVFSFNVMHRVYHPAFADQVPYAVVLIQLDEGPRMISRLAGVAAHEIRIGMRVRVVFEDLDDEVTLPEFVADLSDTGTPARPARA